VITTTGLRGLLEAHQRFVIANALRLPMGVFTFLGPLLVIPFFNGLVPVIAVLALGRFIGCAAHVWACLKVVPALRHERTFDRSSIPLLLSFGGWMTITNIVSPLMVSLDRFFIAAILSVSAVALYAIPSEAITRLLIIPVAFAGVLFPAFSSASALDGARLCTLFIRGVKYIFLACFPIALVITVFAREGLTMWVGADFAEHSTVVLRWLAVGVFFNSVAHIPFALVQGVGRSDLTGKLHMLEFPVYAGLLWMSIGNGGIKGAAIVWAARGVTDCVALLIISALLLPGIATQVRQTLITLAGSSALFLLGSCLTVPFTKAAFVGIVLGASAISAWRVFLTPGEKAYMLWIPENFSR
jgi:O-antigen/teichoic acid export membrane protein